MIARQAPLYAVHLFILSISGEIQTAARGVVSNALVPSDLRGSRRAKPHISIPLKEWQELVTMISNKVKSSRPRTQALRIVDAGWPKRWHRMSPTFADRKPNADLAVGIRVEEFRFDSRA